MIPALVGFLLPAVATGQTEKVIFETGFEEEGEFSELGIRGKQIVEGKNGSAALKIEQRRFVLPKTPIPINPELAYKLTGSFKAAPGSEKTDALMFLRFFDEQGESIPNVGVLPVVGTETVLKADAKAGDTVVLLENPAQSWPDEGHIGVAFDVKADLSDIPNPYSFKIASVAKEDDGLRVTLEDPLTKDFPAQTPVRCHQLAGPITVLFPLSDQWEEHSLTVKGSTVAGDSWEKMKGAFWPGVAAVQITLGFKDRASVEAGREFWVDDLRLVEVTK